MHKMRALHSLGEYTPSTIQQVQFVGGPLQLLPELGGRQRDQAAGPLRQAETEQHRRAILGDHIVDVDPRGGDHRPGRQNGYNARDLSIDRRKRIRVRKGLPPGLGGTSRR
jgi:hypothetical protein